MQVTPWLSVCFRVHGPVINHVVRQCEDSDLLPHISETKDMITDFGKCAGTPEDTTVMGHTSELVQPHKCQDCCWKFTEFWGELWSHVHQRLFRLRKLSYFHIRQTTLSPFYHAFYWVSVIIFFDGKIWPCAFTGKTQTESSCKMAQLADWWVTAESLSHHDSKSCEAAPLEPGIWNRSENGLNTGLSKYP